MKRIKLKIHAKMYALHLFIKKLENKSSNGSPFGIWFTQILPNQNETVSFDQFSKVIRPNFGKQHLFYLDISSDGLQYSFDEFHSQFWKWKCFNMNIAYSPIRQSSTSIATIEARMKILLITFPAVHTHFFPHSSFQFILGNG